MRFFSRKEGGNPLHRAVISNDLSTVKELAVNRELSLEANELGFTAYELAHLLQREEILKILCCQEPALQVKILLPDEQTFRYFGVEAFFHSFGFRYLKTLHFASYDALKSSIRHNSYRSLLIHRESHRLGREYQQFFATGGLAPVSIRWIDNILGYGVFAESAIEENSCIGEYTGLVRRFSRFRPNQNGYCFHYPGQFWSLKLFVVDALYEGNVLRFVNHSDIPNLIPVCMVDRGLTHIAFVAKRRIDEREQLTIDYGKNYWKERIKC